MRNNYKFAPDGALRYIDVVVTLFENFKRTNAKLDNEMC
jgi:hypothetical protein